MRTAVLALRNLARNRRRTALSLGIVAAGTIALVFTAGFVRFSFDGLREAIIHGGLGHLEIVPAAAAAASAVASERPLAHGLEDWQAAREKIEAAPHVLAAGASIQLMGLVQFGDASASFLGVGTEPERERKMGFETKLRGGDPLPDAAPAEGDDVALLGLGLARTLGVKPGDVVTILAMTGDGLLNALDVRVTGLVTTGVQDLDTRFLKIHLATAGRLLETEKISSLIVSLDDTSHTDAAKQDVERRLANPELRVLAWQERAPFYDQVRSLYAGIFWFLGTIVFVLVVLATSNTLLMSVLERVRELGTLLAIGTGRGQLVAMIVAEALWLGLLGSQIGSIAGWLGILGLNAAKLQMPPPPGAVSALDLRLAIVPEAFAGATALMLVVLALAALFPAMRVLRLRIVEALGHV